MTYYKNIRNTKIQSSICIRTFQGTSKSSQLTFSSNCFDFFFLFYQLLLYLRENKKKGKMDRQKSMEKGLLRKSLSIRERKFPNDDLFLETGLSRKSPRDIAKKSPRGIIKKSPRDIIKKSPRDIIKKAENDDGECRVTAIVFLSTFVAVSGSFCTGCGVSHLLHISILFAAYSV